MPFTRLESGSTGTSRMALARNANTPRPNISLVPTENTVLNKPHPNTLHRRAPPAFHFHASLQASRRVECKYRRRFGSRQRGSLSPGRAPSAGGGCLYVGIGDPPGFCPGECGRVG